MKAPSTVRTPSNWVISAHTPMITRIMVTTGNSLRKLSLAQRMAENTSQRPAVKQKSKKQHHAADGLGQAHEIDAALHPPPAPAMPKVMAMITHPHRVFHDGGGDDDLAEIAAHEIHFPHHHGHDLDRGNG